MKKKNFFYLPTDYLEGRVAKGETNNFLRLALLIYLIIFSLYKCIRKKINIFTVFKKISKSLNQRSVDHQQFSVCWTGSDLLTACPTFIGYLK
jgi:hypothetical protein